MAGRRRKRRGRGRRRRSSVSPLLVGSIIIAIIAISAVAAVGYQRGWTVSFGGGRTASSDRFSGLGDVTIPPGPGPEFWWARVSTEDSLVDPNYLPGVEASLRFRRVLIPTDLLYQPDSDELAGSSARALDEVARRIPNPLKKVVVVCHSSSDGPPSARQPLSLRRANALADALEKRLERPAGSIMRIGKGDSVRLPGVDSSTPTGRALHRRCEVLVEAD